MKGTRNILIGTGIVALIIWGVFTFLLWSINGLNNKIIDLTIQDNHATQKQASAQDVQSTLKKIQPDVDKLDTYLVTNSTIVSFIQTVESIAKTAGISLGINSVSLQGDAALSKSAAQKNNTSQQLVIQFVSEGSWMDTYYFVSLLENLPFKISITQMSVSLGLITDKTDPYNGQEV